MRKVIMLLLLLVTVVVAVALFVMRSRNSIISGVKIYDPPVRISSLFESKLTFDEIDRTNPLGALFSKTKVETTNQIAEVYCKDDSDPASIQNAIECDELTDELKRDLGNHKLILSFYYNGDYGRYWFYIDWSYDPKSEIDTGYFPSWLVYEDGVWKWCTDVAGSPIVVAYGDLFEKYNFWGRKEPTVNKSELRAFINDCCKMDEIIKERMKTDPEHYSRVQKL